jgi:hypothetical protein
MSDSKEYWNAVTSEILSNHGIDLDGVNLDSLSGDLASAAELEDEYSSSDGIGQSLISDIKKRKPSDAEVNEFLHMFTEHFIASKDNYTDYKKVTESTCSASARSMIEEFVNRYI